MTTLLMVLALLGQAEPIVESNQDKLVRLTQGAYADCVRAESSRLDDGRESAPIVVKAAMTSCAERRSRAIFAIASRLQIDEKWDADRAARIALSAEDQADAGLTDQVVLQLLEQRKQKVGHARN